MEGLNPVSEIKLKALDQIGRLISIALETGKAISLWKLPDDNRTNLIVSNAVEIRANTDLSIEDSKPGFLISPFNRSLDKYFLPADFHYVTDGERVTRLSAPELEVDPGSSNTGKPKFHRTTNAISTNTDQQGFRKIVEDGIQAISDGRFEKIVPSRRQQVTLSENTDLLGIFEELCLTYPHAFVTLNSTPLTGTWIGASPELLVNIDRQSIFRTTALASTQAYHPGIDLKNVSWNQKEIEEQALVSRYIINCFKKIRLREFEEHGPRTFRAGNLLHLKTDFSVDMRSTNFPQLGTVMIQLLHPTSAVCGMPLEPAIEFLIEKENYDRQLYTGYLGPVNINQESHLYVHLRCMQVNDNMATLYAGAGVTIDSDPELEWEETVIKMNTLQRIIQR